MEKEHICPHCGSTNTRYYFDIYDVGTTEEGYQCNECGYQGAEEEFIN